MLNRLKLVKLMLFLHVLVGLGNDVLKSKQCSYIKNIDKCSEKQNLIEGRLDMTWKQFLPNPEERPLDRLLPDGGLCSTLRTIGCVGDSLSSGEFEEYLLDGTTLFNDMYEHSWGQYLARICGNKVYNFSKGGMSAKEYCETFAEGRGFWDPALACEAYIIALGVNDIINLGQEVGSKADIDFDDWRNNKPTFMGYYGQLVLRLKEISPRAKFFFVTIPRDTRGDERKEKIDRQVAAVYSLAEVFSNAYVIDLNRYAPVYDEAFYNQFFLGTHMNPAGYYLTAKMMISYIDYIIRNNMADFCDSAYICTEHKFQH